MGIEFNGTNITRLQYNGTEVSVVSFNGKIVWQSTARIEPTAEESPATELAPRENIDQSEAEIK